MPELGLGSIERVFKSVHSYAQSSKRLNKLISTALCFIKHPKCYCDSCCPIWRWYEAIQRCFCKLSCACRMQAQPTMHLTSRCQSGAAHTTSRFGCAILTGELQLHLNWPCRALGGFCGLVRFCRVHTWLEKRSARERQTLKPHRRRQKCGASAVKEKNLGIGWLPPIKAQLMAAQVRAAELIKKGQQRLKT